MADRSHDAPRTPAEARAARLKTALKANLARRKAQASARRETTDEKAPQERPESED